MTESVWTDPEDMPARTSADWPDHDQDSPLQEWELELLSPGDPAMVDRMTGLTEPHREQIRAYLARETEVAEPVTPAPAVEVRTRQPVTQIRNRHTGDFGTLVRMDSAGNPVVKFFGDGTEYPHTWDKIEIVSSTEHEMVPGAFEVGLFVDGDGDLWRDLGDGRFRMVQCQGVATRSRSELERENIEDLTGALEPAGSPEATRIRRDTSSGDTSVLLGGVLVTFLAIAAITILVALARYWWL